MEGCSRSVVSLIVLILAAMLLEEAVATKHAVGGSSGWDESTDFDSWASGQTFRVGDELEFKYTSGLHSVVELAGESAYKSCDISSSLNSYNGGSNTIKLSKAGTRYFACGTSGHCSQGMKVKIATVTADAPPSSSSSTNPSLSGGGTSSTTSPLQHHQFHSFFVLITALLASIVVLV